MAESPRMNTFWDLNALTPHPTNHPRRLEAMQPEESQKQSYEEDALILQIIEGYCRSPRSTRPLHQLAPTSSELQPSILLSDDYFNARETLGSDPDSESLPSSRSLNETVQSIEGQLEEIRNELISLARFMKSEQKSRRQLKTFVMRLLEQRK